MTPLEPSIRHWAWWSLGRGPLWIEILISIGWATRPCWMMFGVPPTALVSFQLVRMRTARLKPWEAVTFMVNGSVVKPAVLGQQGW